MAKEAYPFLFPLLLVAGLFFCLGMRWPGSFFLVLSLFIAYFFRDPERIIPVDEAAIVSPADGKVVGIAVEPDKTTRVSIFLSVFNVHINRAPVGGEVESVRYLPGKFKVAFDEAASAENEQNVLVIRRGLDRIKFSQIAGILARRIVCWKKPGDSVVKGERVGLIKFGSRVDIFLPENVTLSIKLGDKVQGGASVIGRIKHA
ncbi:MAG: phosphatidylserine decarboxylase family protein [Acidobacteria bacterium]|nr:phosphatidylserine decarboxylase family protein [Acidobacteriota bacterium]MCI0620595.1 phosphatidylserine decarboxylase family protein [Acidobacteriota bacterium]MCI0720010.1 phosphatidylserine decarboxylase family protein [Acidobacteriota bacterium]